MYNIDQSIKYNDQLANVFRAVCGDIEPSEACQELKDYVLAIYHKVIAGADLFKLIEQPKVTRSRRKTGKVNVRTRDRLNTHKQDMIGHIKLKIGAGYYTIQEFLADPTAYLDSRVMGADVNNQILIKSIVKFFEREYIPF